MIDLRIGNPDSIIEMLSKFNDSVQIPVMAGMPYHKEGPFLETINIIKDLHKKYHPQLIKPNSRIVVGNGASQLISAFFALNSKNYVQSPFWFRTPFLSKKHKSDTEYNLKQEGINLITYPNNPDGKMLLGNSNTWYDCAYLWPWYFSSQKEYENSVVKLGNVDKKVALFTLSKMTGHCGVRFGWAIVDDEDTERKINEYVEFESGGLGYDTQIKTKAIVENLLDRDEWQKIFLEIGQKLNNRKKQLHFAANKNNWFYEETAGMFAWITTQKNAVEEFKKIGILGACGTTCGGTTQQIRLNLAVTDAVWEKIMSLLL